MTVYQQLTDAQLNSRLAGAIMAYDQARREHDDRRYFMAGGECVELAREARRRGWEARCSRGRFRFTAPKEVRQPALIEARAEKQREREEAKAAKQAAREADRAEKEAAKARDREEKDRIRAELEAAAETAKAMREAEAQANEPIAESTLRKAAAGVVVADPGDQPKKARKPRKAKAVKVAAVALF